MTKLAPEWVRTSDPVIRSPARYRWTTAPANGNEGGCGVKEKEARQFVRILKKEGPFWVFYRMQRSLRDETSRKY